MLLKETDKFHTIEYVLQPEGAHPVTRNGFWHTFEIWHATDETKMAGRGKEVWDNSQLALS